MNDDLSARLRLGDPAALEEAMDRYASYAAKIIAVYLNRALPPEDMEEVLSDVFVSLWNSRARLEGEVKPYLAAIARNAARQKLRQARPTEMLPEDTELVDEAPLPEQQAETAEQTAALRQAIDAMAPEDRALFIRVYYLDQTVEEVAAVTGQNPSTLRVRLHRGRKKLKELLQKRGVCCD
ncbi:RNA polymerase sigma factor [Dysosmobacter sp.]|uniref:RNA polymerase sigma factor n=1 Tax=Dysosmobacter sp. TaxID=2591382 RepID=UPI002A8D6233|nr:sigma-70 family RNA polymerase sigma factor [Dysosmobacter sp.]MDY3985039.1 sigma-70 family RNA polymerase sigma factor [Dysosmobacter sp.]